MLTIPAEQHPLMKRMHRVDDEKRSVVVLDDDSVFEWLSATDPRLRVEMMKNFDADDFMDEPAPKPARLS